MTLVTEPQLKHEIATFDRLIEQLETTYREAKGLPDGDLKRTVMHSVASLLHTLRGKCSDMQQQLGSILFGTEYDWEDELERWSSAQRLNS